MSLSNNLEINASDLMDRRPTAIMGDTLVTEAVELMLKERVGMLPVVDLGFHLVGMVSAPALAARAAERLAEHPAGWLRSFLFAGREASAYARRHGRHVSEVMKPTCVTLRPDTPLHRVLDWLAEAEALPVCSDGCLVGVVTRAKVMQTMIGRYRPQLDRRSDDDIRADIDAALAKLAWVPVQGVDYTVRMGAVTMAGAIVDDRLRYGLKAALEEIPGVLVVHERLSLIMATGVVLPTPTDQAA
jgi:CBS domain-containing protein